MPTYNCNRCIVRLNFTCNTCEIKKMNSQIKLSDLLSTEEIAKYSKYVKEQLEKMLNGHCVVNTPKEYKLHSIKQYALFFQNVEAKKLKYNLTI